MMYCIVEFIDLRTVYVVLLYFNTALYTVFRKKTPTHIFFNISMCDK